MGFCLPEEGQCRRTEVRQSVSHILTGGRFMSVSQRLENAVETKQNRFGFVLK